MKIEDQSVTHLSRKFIPVFFMYQGDYSSWILSRSMYEHTYDNSKREAHLRRSAMIMRLLSKSSNITFEISRYFEPLNVIQFD